MSSSLRTLAPFLRTSSRTLRRGQNPLIALQNRNSVFNARTYAAVFARDKPHVNIG